MSGGMNMGASMGGGNFSPAGGFAGGRQAMRSSSPGGELSASGGDFSRKPPTGPRAQQHADNRPPPDAPRGPKASVSQGGPGPLRAPPRGPAARDHPYRR